MIKQSGTTRIILLALLVVLAGVGIYFFSGKKAQTEATLRLGWQPPWVNQGQVVEVLKHSDILQRNGVKVEFIPFTYGGPMTEAALAGSLDIIFAGDQPGITLISKDPRWKIVARMINYRSAIVIPANSTFKSMDDLRGKKIAAAFGSTTHRDLIRELRSAGLDPQKDVVLVNVDQAEHASIIAAGGANTWSGVDAIATYDPTVAIATYKKHAKILKEWLSPAVVAVRGDVLKNHENEIVHFLKSYMETFTLYAAEPSKYNKLYSAESRLELPDSVYVEMAKFEPNMAAKNMADVNIHIDAERENLYQTNADIAFTIGIIKKKINIKDNITNDFNEKAKSSSKK